jgi:hypothetical protein
VHLNRFFLLRFNERRYLPFDRAPLTPACAAELGKRRGKKSWEKEEEKEDETAEPVAWTEVEE